MLKTRGELRTDIVVPFICLFWPALVRLIISHASAVQKICVLMLIDVAV